jgi:hypothetical protein
MNTNNGQYNGRAPIFQRSKFMLWDTHNLALRGELSRWSPLKFENDER